MVQTAQAPLVRNIYGSANIEAPREAVMDLSQAGEFLMDTAEGMKQKEIKQRKIQDKQELAGAKSVLAQKEIELTDGFLNDPDYMTMQARDEQLFDEARNEALQGITNPQLREAFMIDSDLDRARFSSSMKRLAFDKQKDFEVAWTNERLEANRANFFKATPELRDEIRKSSPLMIQALADKNVISREDAQQQIQDLKWGFDKVELNEMAATEAIQVLKAKVGSPRIGILPSANVGLKLKKLK